MQTITKEKLQQIYKTNSSVKAAKILKISHTTMIKYLIANGIPLKGKGNRIKHEPSLKII